MRKHKFQPGADHPNLVVGTRVESRHNSVFCAADGTLRRVPRGTRGTITGSYVYREDGWSWKAFFIRWDEEDCNAPLYLFKGERGGWSATMIDPID